MSELDFEDDIASESAEPTSNLNKSFGEKFPISSEETVASKTNITDITVRDKNNELHEDKPNKQLIDQNSEEGEVESDTGELSESGQDLNDLEEGEINDSNTDGNNGVVCRFFQNGKCRFGLQCRFVHVGTSAYKMFDNQCTKNFPFGVAHSAVLYQPPKLNPMVLNHTANTGDAWEQGLREAKKLVLIARDKKEEDIEFEEKKLYLDVQKERVERDKRDAFVRKSNLEDIKEKHSKSCETDSQSNLPKYARRETSARKQSDHLLKCKSYSESWVDPWRRSRSRTRNRSRSSSSSLSSERRSCTGSCSSACSAYSSPEEAYSPSKKRAPEPESKLKRVFSRIFSRSRSRKRSSSYSRSRSRSLSQSCSPKRPSSRSVTRKRSPYRSYRRSRSSSGNRYSNKYGKKNLSPKPVSKSELLVCASDEAQTHEQLKRNRSAASPPLHQWPKRTPSNSGFESCSSDMTISSITCTSLSGSRNSVDSSSVKSGENSFSSAVVSNVRNDKTSLKSDADFLKTSHINQHDNSTANRRDKVQKTIFTEKQLKLDGNFVPDISKKTTNENSKLERKFPDLNKHYNNQTLLRKPSQKKTAAELELLKYVPAKHRGFAFDQTRTNVCMKLGSTTLPTRKVININLKPKSEVVPSKSEISSVSKTSKATSKTLSRREQLLLQLQAVELAIAKRKTVASPKQ